MEKNKSSYINNVAHIPFQDIADFMKGMTGSGERDGFFKELQDTGEFTASKQRQVREIIKKFEEQEQLIKTQNAERAARQRKIRDILNNVNEYTPDEVRGELDDATLRDLCEELGIDFEVVNNYDEPRLNFTDIPKRESDLPSGYTDVFFWGIPSSGKTCALAAILRTMKDKYTVSSPKIDLKFGVSYRDSLVNIFNNGTGYLPAATQKDRTQYMPFLLKRRGEKNYRQISFFELSGEVFKYFYELENGGTILDHDDREHVETAFTTLNMLLRSNNQKIHFFFIDYNQETKGTRDKNLLTQENYLSSAATYFRDRNDIFKRKTDAVYIVVTKADEIKEEAKAEAAKQFLQDNFGGFIDEIKTRCKKHSVDYNVKLFSIGDVYFKRICKIDHFYSSNIIDDLLKKVKPVEESWFKKLLRS